MMEGSDRSVCLTGRCRHLYKKCRLREPLVCRRNGEEPYSLCAGVKGSGDAGGKEEAWGDGVEDR